MENLVLYIHGKGGNSLTSLETISDFAKNNNAGLTEKWWALVSYKGGNGFFGSMD